MELEEFFEVWWEFDKDFSLVDELVMWMGIIVWIELGIVVLLEVDYDFVVNLFLVRMG